MGKDVDKFCYMKCRYCKRMHKGYINIGSPDICMMCEVKSYGPHPVKFDVNCYDCEKDFSVSLTYKEHLELLIHNPWYKEQVDICADCAGGKATVRTLEED